MRAREVRRVMARGRRLQGERVVLLLAPGAGVFAAVAGKRVGGSVDRNRARRILRAALRELRSSIGDHDVVAVARPAIRGCGTDDLVAEMKDLLRG
jgi:ribonuclease P protein component